MKECALRQASAGNDLVDADALKTISKNLRERSIENLAACSLQVPGFGGFRHGAHYITLQHTKWYVIILSTNMRHALFDSNDFERAVE